MTHPQCTPRCRFAQLDHPPPFHPDQLLHAQASCPNCLDHLVQKNEPLVHWVLQRFASVPLSYDEALQSGRIGLWKALLHFDPGRGFAFSSYAVVAIRRHIQRESQRQQRFCRPLPPVAPAPAVSLLEQAHGNMLAQAIHNWVGQLPPRRAQVLRAYYGLGQMHPQTQRAIAQSLRVSRQRVGQLLQEARLLLALPIYSWSVRLLLNRTSVQDVQAALRAWYRFRRRQRRRENR